MSNLQNLQRDQLHVLKEVLAYTSVPTSVGVGSGTIQCNAEPAVKTSAGAVQMLALAPTIPNGNWAGAATYLDPPTTDDTPYRVKGYIRCSNASAYETFLVVAYAPSVPTGTTDICTTMISIPINGVIDEVILVPVLSSGDANFGLPIAFALTIGQASGSEKFDGYLSVQKMSTASPQYASAVS